MLSPQSSSKQEILKSKELKQADTDCLFQCVTAVIQPFFYCLHAIIVQA